MEIKNVVKAAIGAGIGLIGAGIAYVCIKKHKHDDDVIETAGEELEAENSEVSED